MTIFMICIGMVVLGIYLQKEFWPKIPDNISKYRGLLMAAVLIGTFIILKVPIRISFLSIFSLILILFGLVTFFLDNQKNSELPGK